MAQFKEKVTTQATTDAGSFHNNVFEPTNIFLVYNSVSLRTHVCIVVSTPHIIQSWFSPG
jgi:hypothetical protein